MLNLIPTGHKVAPFLYSLELWDPHMQLDHGSLHVCSLVGSKFLGALGVLVGSIVDPPMGLQIPSAPWVLTLAPPLRNLCTVQWLTESTHHSICQVLAEPFRRHLYQAPVSKQLMASIIASGFGDCIWDESPGGTFSGWSFLWYQFHSWSLYLLLWKLYSHF